MNLQIENPKYQSEVIKLQAAIKYNEDEIQNAKVCYGSVYFYLLYIFFS